jgi:1-deoxy-D-xylulose-5-phosphate reductoisomerase
MKKHIAILGSTGSIGVQALEVLEKNSDYFELDLLTANWNAELLIRQAVKYRPRAVVVANKAKYLQVKDALGKYNITVNAGEESVAEAVKTPAVDVVLAAIVGYAGLLPVIRAIGAGKNIALANKETLVVAGELVTRSALENKVAIYPVDSEHSAIFQCLTGEENNPVEKIYLTASGGPFRGKDIEYLRNVTRNDALKHPNWTMGEKITVDSASLMNKGLEVIEAHWLFGLKPEQIEVVVHPQSIVHSIVQFEDGSMKAQMGLPDMRVPIQYALSFPKRLKSDFPRFSFSNYPNLSFEKPDTGVFRNLLLAYYALDKGGNIPCALNAANEVAVKAFLKDKIKFTEIPEIIEKAISKVSYVSTPAYEDFVNTDYETRIITSENINNKV